MNHATTLTIFFNTIINDDRIHTSHISMYSLLYHYWNGNGFQNPVHISRSDVMKKAKISSKATYHKCIKELHAFGYISYDPSYHPILGSKVHIKDLGQSSRANESR
jgi:hypothetical protein